MSNPPKWAQELTINALLHLETIGLKADVPTIKWRHGTYRLTSGTCYHDHHIVITAGRDRRDQKLVLLHELAHWVMPIVEHHGDTFWRVAFQLYAWAGLPQRVCLSRESRGRSRKRIKNTIAH